MHQSSGKVGGEEPPGQLNYSSREAQVSIVSVSAAATAGISATAARIATAGVPAAAEIAASMAAVVTAAVPAAAAMVMPVILMIAVSVMVAGTAVPARIGMTLVAAAIICNVRISSGEEVAVCG